MGTEVAGEDPTEGSAHNQSRPPPAAAETDLFSTLSIPRTGATQTATGLAIETARERLSRSTKIIATVGKDTANPETIAAWIRAGANVFRLNFSHGDHESHELALNTIREVSRTLNIPVAILQDIQGPKMRISNFPSTLGEKELLQLRTVKQGQRIILRQGEDDVRMEDGKLVLYTPAFSPAETLRIGGRVIIGDNTLYLLAVRNLGRSGIELEAQNDAFIDSKKGLAVPDSDLSTDLLSTKDRADVRWGVEHGVDFIALSFVKDGEDMRRLRNFLHDGCGESKIPIIAKIERREALSNLEEIVKCSDGIMVARGDLGVELELGEVPIEQDKIIAAAQRHGIFTIVATQVLLSMTKSPRPTRAETTDVYNSVKLLASAVMLSEETASGNYPVDALAALSMILRRSEIALQDTQKLNVPAKLASFFEKIRRRRDPDASTTDEIARLAAIDTYSGAVDAIVVHSVTGNTARLVAKYDPFAPVFGVSTNEEALRRMALYRGVNPLLRLERSDEDVIEQCVKTVAREFFAKNPNKNRCKVVVVDGAPAGDPTGVTMLWIREILPEQI